ncbi:hypothetical protein HY771_02890 [Candidatus Uhrbacteria bacterium]|nr:hypothetical protein [Candidatus Uhrbacteria bacterium]
MSLIIHGSDEDGTPVQGDKLIYNGPEGTVEGSISSDLKTITKKIYVIASDKTFTRIFTLVESLPGLHSANRVFLIKFIS